MPETVNAQDELFGEERMLSLLNGSKDADMKSLLSSVRKGIDEFAAQPVAYDDITMIGFKYFGNDKEG